MASLETVNFLIRKFVSEDNSNSTEGSGEVSESGEADSNQKEIAIFDCPSDIVSVRGTEDGLVLRIDGRASWEDILSDVQEFMGDKKKFLRGGQVAIEWLDTLPTKEQSRKLEVLLTETYEVELVSKKPKSEAKPAKACVVQREGKTIPLFEVAKEAKNEEPLEGDLSELTPGEVMELASGEGDPKSYLERMERILGDDVLYEDDSNCKAVFGTLRSGQRIETPFSLIVVGDVNPGADLVAGGDIIVMGSLRGTAHAAAYDEHATDRVVIALQMAPIQLRIGSVISRGSGEAGSEAEVARIEDRRIVVEPFNARMNFGKRLRA